MDELIARLRAVSETGCDPDLPHEAADAIVALVRRAEDVEQLATARGHTIRGLRQELSTAKVERDALAAKFANLEKQEPFDAINEKFRAAFEAALDAGNWPNHRLGHGYRSPMTDMAWSVAFGAVNRLGLFARPAPAEPVSARLLEVALENIPHLYQGDCPFGDDKASRDPECPACQALSAAESQQAEPVRLTDYDLIDLWHSYARLVDEGHSSGFAAKKAIVAAEIASLRKQGYKVEG